MKYLILFDLSALVYVSSRRRCLCQTSGDWMLMVDLLLQFLVLVYIHESEGVDVGMGPSTERFIAGFVVCTLCRLRLMCPAFDAPLVVATAQVRPL